MGLVLNQRLDALSFAELMEQLEINEDGAPANVPVHFGGPVEAGRGFVLHTADYRQDATLDVDDGIALTATVDILKSIARGSGPRQSLLALGYAGWGPGQLDDEIGQMVGCRRPETRDWYLIRTLKQSGSERFLNSASIPACYRARQATPSSLQLSPPFSTRPDSRSVKRVSRMLVTLISLLRRVLFY